MGEVSALAVGDTPRVGPGSRVAGYRIERMIGQGGMAVVFRAHDERLDRAVALKILSPGLSADDAFRQRFIRESRAAAAVDHRHIVPIYEAGETDGLLFIAMRFVGGGDVGSLARSDAGLSAGRVAEIISQAASALDAAHARGLVHRDVKPANMLLEANSGDLDHVYLTDFGLSKAMREASGLTDSGTFLGTINYTAPEQIEGKLVDGRTDQYSLACTAFQLLSGTVPFDFPEVMRVLYGHLSMPPPPLTSRRPDLPAAVNEVFARAMAKASADRFPSCGDFAAGLREALGPVSGDRAGGYAPAGPEVDPGTPSSPTVTRLVAVPPQSAVPPEPAVVRKIISDDYDQPSSDPESGSVPWPDGDSGIWRAAFGRGRSMSIPLKASFRYIHEPSRQDQHALPSLGNDELIIELRNRIQYSRGGSFLITGFRGVGKTTLVLRTLDQIAAESGQDDLIVPVLLSVARSTSTERLLFAVVRRVFETLCDTGAFSRLSPATRQALLVAYMRTSLSFKETQSDTRDRSAAMNLGAGSGKGQRQDPKVHLIIILDEIDKLTVNAPGLAAVEDLLTGIKNVFTMPGAHFLLVAGPDLHDRAVRDAARGNGIYESVFGWTMYVPCTWNAPDMLVQGLMAQSQGDSQPSPLALTRYLRFKSRGVPRRLLQELNRFVVWEDGLPYLRVSSDDLPRVNFYAHLEDVLGVRLAEDVRRRQRSFAVRHEYERAQHDPLPISLNGAPGGQAQVLDGRYELGDLLGQGGVASIYNARDLATGREVAVKLLREALAEDPLAVARVLREGEIGKSLSHPQIVRTYDVLAGNGRGPALVMELLRGPNLQDAITSDAPMSPAETAAIGYALAGALVYLEEKRIARLGMKPGNIIITDRGPVISDLGIAVELDADRDLTRAGQMIGTPAYMAPEQLFGGSYLGSLGDQYALAAVLHYCLTGMTLGDAANNPPMALEVTDEIDLKAQLSRLPVSAQFRGVLTRALEFKPDDRYPKAADFQEALKATPEWQGLPG